MLSILMLSYASPKSSIDLTVHSVGVESFSEEVSFEKVRKRKVCREYPNAIDKEPVAYIQ
jgi:hypothetical protein